MSFEAMLAVQRLVVRTSHACFRVLMTLAEHADSAGRNSWPSIDTIAAESQTDRKTAWRCLATLEEQNLIAGERGRGRGQTTSWTLSFPVRPLGKDGATPPITADLDAQKGGMAPCIQPRKRGVAPSFPAEKGGMAPCIAEEKGGLMPEKGGVVPQKGGVMPPEPVLNLSVTTDSRPPAPDRQGQLLAEAVAIWNTVLGDVLPKAKAEIPAGRRASLRARLAGEMGGRIDNWRSFCQRVRAAPFLIGEGDRGWRPDIDWCLKPTNMAKVLAGNFDQRTLAPARQPGRSYAGCL